MTGTASPNSANSAGRIYRSLNFSVYKRLQGAPIVVVSARAFGFDPEGDHYQRMEGRGRLEEPEPHGGAKKGTIDEAPTESPGWTDSTILNRCRRRRIPAPHGTVCT